ncbi:MAG: DUF1841 family protein [Gammaproteobacteria bacterium]|nr:DUF1841 family protein [Gammaproteobacteria bacterium]
MFVDSRDGARRYFLDVWRKLVERAPLSPLESMIAHVIERHPEYHELLREGEALLAQDFGHDEPAHNPFLHLGLHVALAEQVGADRPPGVRAVHAKLCAQGDVHAAEHRMIECLAEVLWQAQKSGRMPDEQAYLAALERIA